MERKHGRRAVISRQRWNRKGNKNVTEKDFELFKLLTTAKLAINGQRKGKEEEIMRGGEGRGSRGEEKNEQNCPAETTQSFCPKARPTLSRAIIVLFFNLFPKSS